MKRRAAYNTDVRTSEQQPRDNVHQTTYPTASIINSINTNSPLINSSQSSNTKLTSSSYPRRAPRSSRPPRHLTRTLESTSCVVVVVDDDVHVFRAVGVVREDE